MGEVVYLREPEPVRWLTITYKDRACDDCGNAIWGGGQFVYQHYPDPKSWCFSCVAREGFAITPSRRWRTAYGYSNRARGARWHVEERTG